MTVNLSPTVGSVFTLLTVASVWMGVPVSAAERDKQHPRFISSSLRIEAAENEPVTLPCLVQNLGHHSVVWQKGKRVLAAKHLVIDSDSRLSLSDQYELHIDSVSRLDAGNFTCTVSTKPVLQIVHTLMVLYGPQVQAVPASGVVTAAQGKNVSMSCQATGNPAPTVFWQKQHGSLANGKKRHYGSELQAYKISRQMSGVYQCVAENGVGPARTAHITLQVQYAPEVRVERSTVFSGEGNSAHLVCLVDADPRASVSWIRQGDPPSPDRRWKILSSDDQASHTLTIADLRDSDFGTYACQAHNSLGIDHARILLTGVPQRAVVTSGPASTLPNRYDLQWEVRSHSPILEFRVGYRNNKSNSTSPQESVPWKEVKVPSKGSTTSDEHFYRQKIPLSPLQPDSAYQLFVMARNRHGWGARSLTHRFTTMAKGEALESRLPASDAVQMQMTSLWACSVLLVGMNYLL